MVVLYVCGIYKKNFGSCTSLVLYQKIPKNASDARWQDQWNYSVKGRYNYDMAQVISRPNLTLKSSTTVYLPPYERGAGHLPYNSIIISL